jgi:hypothetical protein
MVVVELTEIELWEAEGEARPEARPLPPSVPGGWAGWGGPRPAPGAKKRRAPWLGRDHYGQQCVVSGRGIVSTDGNHVLCHARGETTLQSQYVKVTITRKSCFRRPFA